MINHTYYDYNYHYNIQKPLFQTYVQLFVKLLIIFQEIYIMFAMAN